MLVGCSLAIGGKNAKHSLTAEERSALLRRAQVWTPTKVASMDIMRGPREHGFKPEADVSCTYADVRYGGRTPKFGCALTPKDVVKVRYGRDNGEVYAGVAATRLLWALGFGADALYPVHVICTGCPPKLDQEAEASGGALKFDIAAIERPFPGHNIQGGDEGHGWSWAELDQVDPAAGGAPLAQRDALKLLAVLLQHSDNKTDQQRLVCRSGGGHSREELAACPDPFMMIHDLGETFGRSNLFNREAVGSVQLELWEKMPIWSDTEHCVGNLPPSQTGTLSNPIISEGGRAFLANLLAQMSDRQIRDLFTVARFDQKPHGGGPIDEWVSAFKQKRAEIAGATCR